MKRLFLPLAAAVLLSSCVEWRIGENIRELTETRSYLELTEPQGGCYYASRSPLPEQPEAAVGFIVRTGTEEGELLYARVPVAEYTPSTSLVVWHVPYGDGVQTRLYAEHRTGETRLVARDGKNLYILPESAQMPKDARPLSPHKAPLREGERELIATRHNFWHVPASVLAAPFDYAIDPLLMVVTTPLVDAGACLLGALWYPIYMLTWEPQEKKEASPSEQQ